MKKDDLASKLYFSKEAADYLGISVQRLNKLVHDRKILPLKKSNSGTIFHINELQLRKTELAIFENNDSNKGGSGMFRIDNCTKQEALNFSVITTLLNCSDPKAEPIFEEIGNQIELTSPLIDEKVLSVYSKVLKIDSDIIIDAYNKTERSFSQLKQNDEIIKRGSIDYPPLLAKTEQAPRFLYIRGRKSLLFEKRTVSIVGSRQAAEDAKEKARKLTKMLGSNGITVISGLAKGIDVEAHRAALDNSFNTIAVIGTNLNQYYPSVNMSTQKEIEEKGLVISQFSPASKTQRWFFPLRNGVMSGLSLATIIVEAGETSGALKQADFALKQGRQLIIPRSVYENKKISWPEKYVKRGARIADTSINIIQYLAESDIYTSKTTNEDNDIQEQQRIEDVINYSYKKTNTSTITID
jgi:DNA processing protein